MLYQRKISNENNITHMKKEYIQPATVVVETELMTMIASSSQQTMSISEEYADEELSNNHRGRWGDLWSE